MQLSFQQGSLILTNLTAENENIFRSLLVYDARIKNHRARACNYSEILRVLTKNNLKFIDSAKEFLPINLPENQPIDLRNYQEEALKLWQENLCTGVIVMPTGSGKTVFAMACLNVSKISTLIIVPTIDLMWQWKAQIEKFFSIEIGLIGGGNFEVKQVTISTYDSAVIHAERLGNKFGLIIFDEAHHLPGNVYRNSALMYLAPLRLGLTATPERTDGGENLLYELLGKEVFRIDISELEGNVLANYETNRVYVELSAQEKENYELHRKNYTDFIREKRINFSSTSGWSQFIIQTSRSGDNGKQALKSYLTQKRISQMSDGKIEKFCHILQHHAGEQIIVFTAENAMAYDIGKKFLLPVITHQTDAKERKEMLDNFRSGKYKILITSKVLNEGIDVPAASVGIIFSGTGSVREHVQRLGRILRPQKGKNAVLYELISVGTAEFFVSERRRQHAAYDNKNKGFFRKKF